MTLTINLDPAQSQRLEETARRLNVTAAELARAMIDDLLTRQDTHFNQAADRVLTKNTELYRRLAQ